MSILLSCPSKYVTEFMNRSPKDAVNWIALGVITECFASLMHNTQLARARI